MTPDDNDRPPIDYTKDWHWVKGWPAERMPGCATCGAKAIGLMSDGGPRYPTTCLHAPIYPKKETK